VDSGVSAIDLERDGDVYQHEHPNGSLDAGAAQRYVGADRNRMKSTRGQSLLESILLIAVATAALWAMFAFVQGAIQEHMKGGADGIGHGLLYGN
jgi:hypothetical protein